MEYKQVMPYLWGKSIPGSDRGFPVHYHALDVAVISSFALEHLLPEQKAKEISERLEVNAQTVLKFLCAVHDCGKASSFFAIKVPELFSPLASLGLPSMPVGASSSQLPHSIISGFAVCEWLEKRIDGRLHRKARKGLFNILAGHHGAYPGTKIDREYELYQREGKVWHTTRFAMMDALCEELAISQEDILRIASIHWELRDIVLFTSLLIISDWLGSNSDLFPYEVSEAHDISQRATEAVMHTHWGHRWRPSSDPINGFAERFRLPQGTALRPTQEAAIEAAQRMTEPSLLLIEDATGGGKTAAALTAAEILAQRFGLNGIYFAQPTQVNSNAMLSTVLSWLSNAQPQVQEATNVVLAHGKASLNDEYAKLRSHHNVQEIYDDFPSSPSHTKIATAEANSWFSGSKRALLGSVVVGTIDQFLMAALASKHVMLRHLGLFSKVVILDEIHASDPYMSIYLRQALIWMGYYGVPVIALSATIPADKRVMLVEAYRQGTQLGRFKLPEAERKVLTQTGLYPRLTLANAQGTQSYGVTQDSLHKTTQVDFVEGDLAEVADHVVNETSLGGCAAIICSTVNRAQALFKEVSARLNSPDEVVLLHSRFMAMDRAQKERDLVDRLGRSTENRPKRLIVVSTQVIEQGLDLDFDLMISDIAPIDLLLQRMGRLHRHEQNNPYRPATMARARFEIMGLSFAQDEVPAIARGSVPVYRSYRLLRAVLALQDHLKASGGVIVSPDDIPSLIHNAYDVHHDSLSLSDNWVTALQQANALEERSHAEQRARANNALLPSPTEGVVSRWSEQMTTGREELTAQVRDIAETLEVILVQRINGRVYPIPQDGETFGDMAVDGELPLDFPLAKHLARCSVQIPGYMLDDEDIGTLESEGGFGGWLQTPLLRGQLPLILDENLSKQLKRAHFRYDSERGLLMNDPPAQM